MMEHCDKKGNSKVLPSCTLPITGNRVVSLLVTEFAVFDFKPDGNGACRSPPGMMISASPARDRR